jgi:hypothetical protein
MAVAAARKRCILPRFFVIGVTQSAKGGGLAISIVDNRYLVGGVAEVARAAMNPVQICCPLAYL